eukprot:667957-Pyramimonas_sp.AAC.1
MAPRRCLGSSPSALQRPWTTSILLLLLLHHRHPPLPSPRPANQSEVGGRGEAAIPLLLLQGRGVGARWGRREQRDQHRQQEHQEGQGAGREWGNVEEVG